MEEIKRKTSVGARKARMVEPSKDERETSSHPERNDGS
jgi:hypothetical protein